MYENKFRSQSQSQLKSNISQKRIPQPSSYSNGIKLSKKCINNSSSHSISTINANKNLDFKDSLEGSVSESKTNLLIPDSLNNTKSSIGNNYFIKKNSKNILKKKNNNIIENGSKFEQNKNNEEKTKKIDYRFYSQFSFKFGGDIAKNKEKENNKYWLAVYDKLMKTKKILKILSYYEKEKNKKEKLIYNNDINNINQEEIKEQLLIIKDFDIYFINPSNRPFIKYVKGNCIFTKIYLLTFEQIIFILNYINRYKLVISSKISNLLIEKGSYHKINETFKNFPYNMIYGMGSYMNINIIGFSNYNIQDQNNLSNSNNLNQNYPNSRKIAKLVKILMINFPKYSFKFFVCYLLSKIRFENFGEKTNEIKNIVYSTNKSFMPLKPKNHNKIISNSLIHSSYSPLSNYEDLSQIKKLDIKNNTDNNNIYYNSNYYNYNNYFVQKKQRIKGNNSSNEFHTTDNRNYKYYRTKNNNRNNISNIKNKNDKTKNLSERKNIIKKHSESVYLNGYIGTANNIKHSLMNKSKSKKETKEIKTSITQLINNFNSSRSSLNKNKRRLNKSEMLRIKSSNNKNNNRINYIQVKNNNKENGILKSKKKGIDIFNINNTNNINDEEKIKAKKRNKLITNTKSEETKICSTNKEIMNNSYRAEINKENTGIFVVSKKIINDDFMDDDSSIELNNKGNEINNNINNGKSIEYMTPEKKKKYKYYS